MLVGVLFAILLCRHIRRQALYVKANDSPETADLLTFGKPADVQLDQTVARGRYGIVWQGVSEGEHVAVKVTNDRNKDTWRNECQLLSTSFMRHPNIVRYSRCIDIFDSYNRRSYFLQGYVIIKSSIVLTACTWPAMAHSAIPVTERV